MRRRYLKAFHKLKPHSLDYGWWAMAHLSVELLFLLISENPQRNCLCAEQVT